MELYPDIVTDGGVVVEYSNRIDVGDDIKMECLEKAKTLGEAEHNPIDSVKFTKAKDVNIPEIAQYTAEIRYQNGKIATFTKYGNFEGEIIYKSNAILEEIMPANNEEPNNNANPFGINNYDGENNNIINNEVNNNINNYNGANNNINNNEVNNNINNGEVNNNINNIKDQIDAYHEETLRILNEIKGYNNANKNIIIENPEKANINKINEFYRPQKAQVKIIESNPKYATAEITFRNGRVITCTSRWGTLIECEKGITVGDMIKCLEDINEYANSLHKSIKSIRFTQAIRTDLESCDIYRAEISFNDGVEAYYTREGEVFGFGHKAGTSILDEIIAEEW